MMLAENDGIIIKDWREFWMGHKGSIEAVYTVNKGLPEDVIERMRSAYAKAAEKYLITSKNHDHSFDKLREETNKRFLQISGFSDKQIQDIVKEHGDLGTISDEKYRSSSPAITNKLWA
ncbi:hypothetical protein NTE_00234 [Candidatus Nitrososphaera evergladensis SR1]|uniref:Uncharacterized protein n=1 Tax=Candidatus Nitrososphaera evergladensis SR1 TaxID=1459636 RepID=A0A075MLH8_9ARCH|nr:hypothetical protein [Candidatus Nitrososphaera evergladensis]AIF82316.1 hypothetical protein NTE_00234 [Candidatus Nitrososphaera evergladensis SR1]